MSDVDRLVNIYWAVSHVLLSDLPGDLVELGCNAGRTSVFLQMIIDCYSPLRKLHLYDSFEGLPTPGPEDAYLRHGDCRASIEDVERNFDRFGLRSPTIHHGWFQQILPTDLPETIAFAYLDSDFYDSILTSLVFTYPRLSRGALLMVDDYCDSAKNPKAWPGLPGVKRACDDFLIDKTERMSVLVGNGDLALGLLRKS
jgi:O-methyltransferase